MPRLAARTLLISKGHADLWCVIDVHHFQRDVLRSAAASAVPRCHADGKVAHVVIARHAAENAFLCVKVQPFGQCIAIGERGGVGKWIAIGIREGFFGQSEAPFVFLVRFLRRDGGINDWRLICPSRNCQIEGLLNLCSCLIGSSNHDAISSRGIRRCTGELSCLGIKFQPDGQRLPIFQCGRECQRIVFVNVMESIGRQAVLPRLTAFPFLISECRADLRGIVDVHDFQRKVLRGSAAFAVICSHSDGKIAHIVIARYTAEGVFGSIEMQPSRQHIAVAEGGGISQIIVVGVIECIRRQSKLQLTFFIDRLRGNCRAYLRWIIRLWWLRIMVCG